MALSAQLRAAIARRIEKVAAEREAVNAQPVNADPVNAQAVNAQKSRSGSKHPPGYMAAYMRKRRAK